MPTVLDHSCTCILSFFLEYPEKYKCYVFWRLQRVTYPLIKEIFFTKLFLFKHGFLDDLFLWIKLYYFRILIGLFYSRKLYFFSGKALHFFTLHEPKWFTKLKSVKTSTMIQPSEIVAHSGASTGTPQ